LSQFLDQDLDENTRGWSSLVFIQVDSADDMPANSVGREKMTEELCDNAKTVGFQTMNCVVVLDKRSLKELIPHAVDLAKTLTNQAKELVVSTFLGATLNDHRGEFVFQSRW
jgi:predicted GTPase